MNKSACPGCNKMFQDYTLLKNGGTCARCAKKKVPGTVENTEPPKPTKKTVIPSKIRQQVWERDSGDKFWGSCFVCSMRLNALEFSCGHIVSEFNGGKVVAENMKVVCKSCNSKMGTQNLFEFKEQRYCVPATVGGAATVGEITKGLDKVRISSHPTDLIDFFSQPAQLAPPAQPQGETGE